jgi:hypothetical protein
MTGQSLESSVLRRNDMDGLEAEEVATLVPREGVRRPVVNSNEFRLDA